MFKRLLDVILVSVLFAAPLAAFALPGSGVMVTERRLMAPFPEAPGLRQREVRKFFRGVDAFFSDRFPLRPRLLGLSAALYGAMDASPNSDACFRGKEDWLFTGNSYGRFVDKFQGAVTFSDEGLKEQTETFARFRNAAQAAGAEFFLIVSPEKISVYPEMLPLYIIPAPERYVAPLLSALAEAGVAAVDPTDRLKAEKSPSRALYYRTDTHWNLAGGHVAFEAFREKAGLPPLPPFSLVSLPPIRGDLVDVAGYTSFPLREGDNFAPRWDPPLPVTDEGGGLFTNPAAPSGKTVWVFGDSANYSMRPYFTAMFRKVRFFRAEELETVMAARLHGPDMVVMIKVERTLG
ncbi:MAG: hypothetical protein LBW85_03165 [Deltaproteobacteria bacterium]|jgi:hypothetical protein|nr:hypothetical protein [Deltaproteobacteria bacterium]